jgi:hypothetical protein
MKTFTRKNTWLNNTEHGWGNGYVLIDKDHPLYGKYDDEINVYVHGGITWSKEVDNEMIEMWNLDQEDLGKWCIGFDTAHFGDTIEKWPEEAVIAETERLKNNLIDRASKAK